MPGLDPQIRRTLIVVPAWNEEQAIVGTLNELRQSQPSLDIAVIDDGSDDGTAELAEHQSVMVLRLPFNIGVGGAMRTGFEYAFRMGYDRVIQVDADGQHDPTDIQLILGGLDGADICVGSRFAGKGEYSVRGPRRWAMRLLAWSISRLAHTRLTDVTSGFRAAGPRAIDLYRRDYPTEYLGDTVDSLVMAVKSGLTVTQVPVEMRQRQGGTPSTSPLKSAIYLGRSLLALLISLTRPTTKREGGN